MNLINVLLLLLCIVAVVCLSYLKKRLLSFSLKLGGNGHHFPSCFANFRKRARMGRN